MRETKEEKSSRILVSWLGGEPFMWPHLEAIELEFAELLGLALSVTTNGTLLGSQRFRLRLLERYTEVTVSLDTTGPAFDALRGWPGGFDTIRKGIEQLSSDRAKRGAKLLIRVNAVLTRDTVDKVPELVQAISRLGVDEVTFNALGGVERPGYFSEHSLLAAQIDGLIAKLPELRSLAAKGDMTIAGSGSYFERMAGEAKGIRFPVSDCHPGEGFLYIDIDGRISPCFETANVSGIPLTKVVDAEDIEALPKSFRKDFETSRAGACLDCRSTRYFGKFIEENR
jgi:MoaA/NifB/PqqE/SkfB family radical SAM enzyme